MIKRWSVSNPTSTITKVITRGNNRCFHDVTVQTCDLCYGISNNAIYVLMCLWSKNRKPWSITCCTINWLRRICTQNQEGLGTGHFECQAPVEWNSKMFSEPMKISHPLSFCIFSKYLQRAKFQKLCIVSFYVYSNVFTAGVRMIWLCYKFSGLQIYDKKLTKEHGNWKMSLDQLYPPFPTTPCFWLILSFPSGGTCFKDRMRTCEPLAMQK